MTDKPTSPVVKILIQLEQSEAFEVRIDYSDDFVSADMYSTLVQGILIRALDEYQRELGKL